MLQQADCGLDDQGIGGSTRSEGKRLLFLFSLASGPSLGPNQSVVQWVQGAVSPGVRQQGCEADHVHAKAENGGAVMLS